VKEFSRRFGSLQFFMQSSALFGSEKGVRLLFSYQKVTKK
jgi:hypothetical protein